MFKSKRQRGVVVFEINEASLKWMMFSYSNHLEQIRQGLVSIEDLSIEERPGYIKTLSKEMRLNQKDVQFLVSKQFVLERRFLLPSCDDSQIEKMIALQLVENLPFNLDEIIFDWQVLSCDKNQNSHVIVVVILKSRIMPWVDLFMGSGIVIQSLQYKPSLIAQWIDRQEFKSGEIEIVTSADAGGCLVCFCRKAQILFSRILLGREIAHDQLAKFIDESRSVFVEEFDQYCINEMVECEFKDISINDLICCKNHSFDLLPDEMKFFQRKKSINTKIKNIAFGCFIILMIFLFSLFGAINKKEMLVRVLKEEKLQFSTEVEEAQRLIDVVTVYKSRAEARIFFPAFIEELSHLLKPSMVIESMSITEEGKCVLEGVAKNSNDITQFQDGLLHSRLLDFVDLKKISKRRLKQVDMLSFIFDLHFSENEGGKE